MEDLYFFTGVIFKDWLGLYYFSVDPTLGFWTFKFIILSNLLTLLILFYLFEIETDELKLVSNLDFDLD